MTFYNILSKEREKIPKKNKIIIDNREKNSLVPSELSKLNFELEFKQLEIADYLINNIAIERKTISDLQSSIIDKRIFKQLEELKQYEKSCIIIEGNLENSRKILSENAIRGFILFCTLDKQIPIIFTQNEKETAQYMDVLARRDPNKTISLKDKKVSLNKSEQAQYILEGFPNVGPVKAKKLLAKFKSIKNIINSEEKDLEPLLGKKTKDFLALANHQS
ncbi:MAG: ERCC4 domain-containing protein [archaeon]